MGSVSPRSVFLLLLLLLMFQEYSEIYRKVMEYSKVSKTQILQIHRKFDENVLFLNDQNEIAPLFPGYGTHFVYVFVGSPAQRQTVIVDTGSHYTAFPCVGCTTCGSHLNPYYDPSSSTTSQIPKCNNNKPCSISQSYSEGSSWIAYKAQDRFYVGGLQIDSLPNSNNYESQFTFGCVTFENGLFRTQLADGIMGLSRRSETFPYNLHDSGVTSTKIFSLCFRPVGGIMAIGGYDTSYHTGPLKFAKLVESSSEFYIVKVLEMKVQDQESRHSPISVSGSSTWNQGLNTTIFENTVYYFALWYKGRGTIVDSGTTYSFLPSSIETSFKNAFSSISGLTYSSNNNIVHLSYDDIKKLPNIIIVLDGSSYSLTMKMYNFINSMSGIGEDDPVDVVIPYSSYIASESNGYVYTLYFRESSGAVLGANFFNKHDVIFDPDGYKLGIAQSECDFDNIPSRMPTPSPGDEPKIQSFFPTMSYTSYPPSTQYASHYPTTGGTSRLTNYTNMPSPSPIYTGNSTWSISNNSESFNSFGQYLVTLSVTLIISASFIVVVLCLRYHANLKRTAVREMKMVKSFFNSMRNRRRNIPMETDTSDVFNKKRQTVNPFLKVWRFNRQTPGSGESVAVPEGYTELEMHDIDTAYS